MKLKIVKFGIGLLVLLLSQMVFAQTIVVAPNTIVSDSQTYDDVTLDMSKGNFIVKNKATLTISNSVITGNLSKDNPILINVDSGNIDLHNNKVALKAINIEPHPTTQSLYYFIQVALGNVKMDRNDFSIDKPFTAGLFITTASIPTSDFKIVNNTFRNFHGVLYLISSDKALVADNIFKQNTYGNLVNMGNHNKILRNTIYFSGNNRLGNSIDIIDSQDVLISKNLLFTPTCHGIYVLTSRDLVIDSNRITGGITYAMNFLSYPEKVSDDAYVTEIVANATMKNQLTGNITITNNYMAQNRFGIAASDVNGLKVKNNVFIQKFVDAPSRQFWTDNSILLKQVKNLTWQNNLYKEAFTQAINGSNKDAFHFIPFPVTGGITL